MFNMQIKKLIVAVLTVLTVSAVNAGGVRTTTEDNQVLDPVPTGKGYARRDAKSPLRSESNSVQTGLTKLTTAPTATGYGIIYHGGKVMDGLTNNIYYIWYGNWANNTATTILPDLASSIGGSPMININTTYKTSSQTISNQVGFDPVVNQTFVTDTSKYGLNLTDANIYYIVSDAIKSGKLPKDPNGVYFVLTSQEVNASSGFCRSYCGWHTYNYILGTNIKYSFVGNPARCPSTCTGQPTKSPNNNVGADGMASVIVHELHEAITDPYLNAWYDSRGYENADKCAWNFGTRSIATNGSYYNVTLGSRQFYIQQNWVNAQYKGPGGVLNGYCGLFIL
jgi:hypothetical protein